MTTKPQSSDHDYFRSVEEEMGDVSAQLAAAKKELERLQNEFEKAKCLSRFGLSRYSYNHEMTQFCSDFPSWKLLEMFICLVKPCAETV